MTSRRVTALISCLALFCVFTVLSASADEWNKKTKVTISEPIEVPGMVLSPGTYTFKLAESPSNRNIVQIWNSDQTHLYTTVIAVPDYRMQPAGKVILKFAERPTGSPEALRAWFYPGDNFGEEFAYPKSRATELAKANNVPVLSMPNEMASNMTKPIKSPTESAATSMQNSVTAVNPQAQEVGTEEAAQSKPGPGTNTRTMAANQQSASANNAENAAGKNTQTMAAVHKPKRLPQTASPLPLLTLIAFSILGAGLLVRRRQTAGI